MDMIDSYIGLNDLPDEILIIIFRKLKNIDVLHSFQGINKRLSKIILDPIFTSHLTFIKWLSHDFIDLLCCDTMRNRFCLKILPEIHDKIHRLDLESSSMAHVLRAANYPNLYSLGLYNIDEESTRSLFTDVNLCGIFKNQITTLFITIYNNNEDYENMLLSVANISDTIFTVFTRLIIFVLYESSYKNRVRLTFDDPLLPNFRSSTLLKLYISVSTFNDCLCLLDGRFNQLHTFFVNMANPYCQNKIENQSDLPTLKCFSLSCDHMVYDYDEAILPLLYRMSNLEELSLCLRVDVENTFIDGNHLKINIINRIPRLNQFRFHICSSMYLINEMYFPSTKDIQHTFIDFPYNNIISYVDYFKDEQYGQCHIYSYPSSMEYYSDITNNFPGGLFKYVRVVSLFDELPFEHEFFLQIVQSFPLMEQLSLTNHKSQNRKLSYRSNIDNQNLSLIEYFLLDELYIVNVADDYIEQYLFHTKTYLQNNIHLQVNSESLQRVTHNFTRDATRINCAKISKLSLHGQIKDSTSLKEYFPYAKICYPLYIRT